MVNIGESMKLLARIKRDRDLVKESQVSEAAKAKLLADLDRQVAAISAELEKADQTAAKRP